MNYEKSLFIDFIGYIRAITGARGLSDGASRRSDVSAEPTVWAVRPVSERKLLANTYRLGVL